MYSMYIKLLTLTKPVIFRHQINNSIGIVFKEIFLKKDVFKNFSINTIPIERKFMHVYMQRNTDLFRIIVQIRSSLARYRQFTYYQFNRQFSYYIRINSHHIPIHSKNTQETLEASNSYVTQVRSIIVGYSNQLVEYSQYLPTANMCTSALLVSFDGLGMIKKHTVASVVL